MVNVESIAPLPFQFHSHLPLWVDGCLGGLKPLGDTYKIAVTRFSFPEGHTCACKEKKKKRKKVKD